MLRAIVACVATALVAGCASSWGGSIGAVLARENPTGRVYVRDAPDGMPAAKAGLVPGDEIVAIDGKAVLGMSADEVHKALEGSVGTKVRLTVTTREGTPREVKVERGPLVGANGS